MKQPKLFRLERQIIFFFISLLVTSGSVQATDSTAVNVPIVNSYYQVTIAVVDQSDCVTIPYFATPILGSLDFREKDGNDHTSGVDIFSLCSSETSLGSNAVVTGIRFRQNTTSTPTGVGTLVLYGSVVCCRLVNIVMTCPISGNPVVQGCPKITCPGTNPLCSKLNNL